MSVDDLKSKLWSVFGILRSENISSGDYYAILFFLSIYKDKLVTSEILSDNTDLNSRLVEILQKDKSEIHRQYLTIYQILEPTLKGVSKNGLSSLFHIFDGLDPQVLLENFHDIFDDILYRIAQSQGRYGGEFIQPIEITRFICSLAELPRKAKIFNPFAGLASFGVYLDHEHDYFGQEINQKTWAIGALRIMAYKRPEISRYMCYDSIMYWPDETHKYDLIVANPPYGMRLSEHHRDIHPGIRTIEQFLIEKGVQSLNRDGKLIALLPQGFLFREHHEQRLREHLIEEDLIDTIISLPAGLLLNTGIPLIVLIIDRQKKMPGKVRFIEAKKFVGAKSSRKKVLKDYDLINIVNSDVHDSNIIRYIDNRLIQKLDYNLNVPRYFQKKYDGVKLKQIVKPLKGRRSDFHEDGKIIKIRDLKDDKLDFMLDLSKIDKTELERPNLRLIEETCLLLATRWKTLKPTIFDYTGEPIFLNPDIISLNINETKVDAAYLINELHADYVQEQLESYRLGATIPMIRRKDLLEVVVKLPSLEEQRAKVQGIVELSDKIELLEKERNTLVQGKATSQFNEFASLKHTLGRPRQNILDWTDNLLHFLSVKRDGFDVLNKAFLEFYETDILSVLREIKRDVNFMTDVLEKGENGFVVEEFEKLVISLSDINNVVNELSGNGFKFKIKKLLLKGEKMKKRGVYGNKVLLKTLIDNLLTNAQKYGFEKKAPVNEVVFELTEVDEYLSLEVRNNGKPFPKNFDREKFITKYSTADLNSGSGLGGYDIHRIASHFNNPDWELELNEDPLFPVKFKFQFPIKLIY